MKRLVAAFLCVSLVFTQYKQAEAAVPVVVAGVAAGAVLLLAAGAVNYYSNPSGASAVATAAGNIYSNVTAYTSVVSALGQGYLMSQSAALGVTASNLITAAKNASSGVADTLKSKLFPPVTPPFPTTGSIISIDGSNYELGEKYSEGVIGSQYFVGWKINSYGLAEYISPEKNSSGTYQHLAYYATPTTKPVPPPPVPADPLPADVPTLLGAPADGGTLPADVVNDINNLIKNNPSIATPLSVETTSTRDSVTDSDKKKTLPPYVPPATLPGTSTPLTPITTLPGTSTGLGSATTTAAQQNVATAQQQVTTAEQQLAADPSNAALQQQLAAAQQALAAAQAALDQAKAAENEVYVNPLFPNRKTLNLESWRQLVNVLPTKFPFNLVTTLGSYFEPFLAAPVAPSFELHIYQDKKLNIDLSLFDTPVAIFRWGLALLLTFGMVQLLIRWWKGTA
jgi:hypothetical protein